ncbi:MAG: LysE family translocator [Acidobacteriales bacterium]|nr:LysE family translocator [Terriglobales bacterium]
MPDLHALTVFVIAALIILVVPGPAVLYITARSIDQGRLAGVVSVLGVATGALVHVAAAALGISAVLLSSALAFSVVKYLGAAYLIYLGIRKLMIREELQPLEARSDQKLARIFFQGIVVNVLNPKTALFFFAFIPQFVDPARGSVALQIMLLGGLFAIMGVLSDGTYAVLAGTLGQWLKGNLRVLRAQRYFAGSVYIGLGLTTAFADAKSK